MLAVVLALVILIIIWLMTGCAVLTQRTAKVTYSKGCSVVVEGVEVQKAAETARQIQIQDCETKISSGAEQ
jgi:uncharacterized protein YceK